MTVNAEDNYYDEGTHLGIISHNAVSLDSRYNGINIANITAQVTDNDTAGVVVSPSAGLSEVGPTFEIINYSLTSLPTDDVTIDFTTPDGQTSVFPASLFFTSVNGMTDQPITITAVDDTVYEDDPHVGLIWGNMSSADVNYNGIGSLSINIADNDLMPEISINDVTKAEGNSGTKNFNFTVSLSGLSGKTTYVTYETNNGTATLIDNDYNQLTETLLAINPLDISEPIIVVTNTDTNPENNETFFVNLSAPLNATITDGQGVGTILDDDTLPTGGPSLIYTPADLTCEAVDLTVNNAPVKAINWNFTDNNTTELGFRLYGIGLIRDVATADITQIQEPDVTQDPITGLLGVNQTYTRTIRAYTNIESADSNQATCYTLANKPNRVQIVNVTADSITIKLDPNDGNPPETKYAIRVISEAVTNFVNPNGSFSPTENWYTYAEFGGATGVFVTGITPATAASVQMVLTTGQNYSFSAKAKNGDGIETAYSEANNSNAETGTGPVITAVKGVAVNLAWNSSLGLVATAWAGDNLIIDLNGTLNRLISAFSWLLNIALIVPLIIFSLSLHQSLSYLRHKFKYPETFKLILSILSGEAHHSYKNYALQTEEGVYHQTSYAWHKQLHNLSQNTFWGSLAIVGFKLLILGALVSGLVTMNHGSLAQTAPYTQSGTAVNVGDALSYIVEVTNNGTASASEVVISDALSSYLTYQPGTAQINLNGSVLPGGVTVSGNNLTFDIGDLDINEIAYVVFKATVNSGSEEKFIPNSAIVTGSNFTTLTSNATSNEVESLAPTNANSNINQPPIIPPPTNTNQPPVTPVAVCGNGIIETGESCDVIGCATNQQCTNCQCVEILPINANGNINQPPVVPPGSGTIEPQIPIFGSIIEMFIDPINTIFNNPKVEQASQNVVTPILIAIAAINVLPAVLFSTLYLMPFLHLLFLEPLMLLFGKKRKKWGIVYNSLTKLPVDLALVRLYNKETNQLVQTKVTDREGRYIMIAKEPGKYYLSVTKPGFISPTGLLRDEKQDTKYIDLYHGEVIEVTEKDAVLTANIPLDPAEKRSLAFSEVIRSYLLKNLRLIVSYVGIILALVVVLIIPTAITIGCLILHILFFLAFRHFIQPAKPKSWGIVYDGRTKEPLSSSVVRIFDLKFNKLLETQVTDRKGRYSFLVGKNEYQLLTEKPGYQNKEVKPVDLVKNEEIVNLDVSLDKI